MNSRIWIGAFLALLAATGAAFSRSMSPSAEQVAFMAGNWECTLADGSKFHETWLTPEGGTMQGLGRRIKDGKVIFMEFLAIEPGAQGELTMYIMLGAPSRGDKKPKAFKLTSSTANQAVFEMPVNAFPSKIEYARKSAESLQCRISGKSGEEPIEEIYDFRPRKQ